MNPLRILKNALVGSEMTMKKTLPQVVGWCWIAIVLLLYAAQGRYRPSGLIGSLLNSFFDAMKASYLH